MREYLHPQARIPDEPEATLDPQDFDARIAEVEARIRELDEQRRQAINEFTTATIAKLSTWYEEEAKRAVTSYHPERATQVGKNGVDQLRDDVRALTAQLPVRAQQSIEESDEREWQANIQRMANALGNVLVQHEFIRPGQQNGPPGDSSPWKYTLNTGSPAYTGTVEYTTEMQRALTRYSTVTSDIAAAWEQLPKLQRQKLEAEAEQLWNESDQPSS